jgi:sarcosine oxidase
LQIRARRPIIIAAMQNPFDVIVVGVGAMGSATCFELSRRGARVLGLEQFDIPHARGSSHGCSRMIRLAYYEHPHYVPLLRRAYERWRELEQLCGERLLHVTGGVYIGRTGSELVKGSLRSAREHGLEHERLDHAQLAKRFPQFQLPDDFEALYEPMAGWLPPERVISAYVEQALRQGATIHAHEPVRDWSDDAAHVTVRTDRATYHAQHLIFCGGPWTAQLLRDLGVQLVVTRQAMLWVWPRRCELFGPDRFCVWAIGHDDGTLHYGFPMSGSEDDGVGLKLAHHARGSASDPDRVAREPLPGDEAGARSIFRFMPDADGPVLALRVCLYTNSPDSHFIIDRHPRHDRVTLACGFSGHGFKFASVVGEVLADLALGGTTALPVEFLSLRRF